MQWLQNITIYSVCDDADHKSYEDDDLRNIIGYSGLEYFIDVYETIASSCLDGQIIDSRFETVSSGTLEFFWFALFSHWIK